jgi:tight adherence protein C
MTPLALIMFGGMLIAVAIVLGVLALRPAPPQLSAALAQLTAAPASMTAVPVTAAPDRWGWLPAPVARFIEGHVGVSDADLAIVDMARAQLAARKVCRAGFGLLLPAFMTALLALIGAAPPFVLPAGFALALAIILWVTPSSEVKTKASKARAQFRAALRSFLTRVAQERASRGSPTEALEESSRSWQAWSFQLLHTEVLRAELAGEQPWDALRNLGTRLGVEELRALADIVSTAADGAAVFDTLLAEARNLHHAELAAQQAEANATSERLIQPIALLAIGFVLLLLVPPLLRLFNT